jgi:DNA-binding transcriptional ArsR family regulator
MDSDTIFTVLADPTRRRVVELLAERPHRAGELADTTGASRSAMSNHLRLLLDHELVEDERLPEDARARQFRLRPEALTTMQAWLDQLGAHWRVQLNSFKHHTEQQIESQRTERQRTERQ